MKPSGWERRPLPLFIVSPASKNASSGSPFKCVGRRRIVRWTGRPPPPFPSFTSKTTTNMTHAPSCFLPTLGCYHLRFSSFVAVLYLTNTGLRSCPGPPSFPWPPRLPGHSPVSSLAPVLRQLTSLWVILPRVRKAAQSKGTWSSTNVTEVRGAAKDKPHACPSRAPQFHHSAPGPRRAACTAGLRSLPTAPRLTGGWPEAADRCQTPAPPFQGPQSSGVGKRPLWAPGPQNCARVGLLTQSTKSPVHPCRMFLSPSLAQLPLRTQRPQTAVWSGCGAFQHACGWGDLRPKTLRSA